MDFSSHRRAKSYPPPIVVEDTASGARPQFSTNQPPRSNTAPTQDSPESPDLHSQHTFGHEHRQSTWERNQRRRHRSPDIEWHEKWTKDSWQNGRVLLIDYVDTQFTPQGRRKIVAQEFNDIDGLRKFYRNEELSKQAALRVIHVQNASWATRFLLRKFNIDANDDLVGTDFGRWARFERPQRRGNKPVLNGRTFRAQRDPWRGISRTSFGCDYLKHYHVGHKTANLNRANSTRMMPLNHYDENDVPAHLYDVCVQRLSVYVQLSYAEPGTDIDPEITNPYEDQEEHKYHETLKKQYNTHDYIPKLQTLDNGNTIILFEHSQSGSVEDTLIAARQEIETKWRRLTFYMAKADLQQQQQQESGGGTSLYDTPNSLMVTKCMDFILRDIFRALAYNWEKLSAICETHVGILEDKIYENPADETRAPELWTNASLWLKVERLMYLHTDLVREMRTHLHDLDNVDPDDNSAWLDASAEQMDKLTTLFTEGVVKPTDSLSDLMYKSVGIRDAQHSLQLGLSMWRLSWITFIFLPLTFVSGFFGMNVDTFSENPSIKYFVVAAVTTFALVIISWYAMKHSLSALVINNDTQRRAVYERLYADFAAQHPALWTRRGGPRTGVNPIGFMAALKWRIITYWFPPPALLIPRAPNVGDPPGSGSGYSYNTSAAGAANARALGTYSRLKNRLAARWLASLPVLPQDADGELGADEVRVYARLAAGRAEKPALSELMAAVAPLSVVGGAPSAAKAVGRRERWRSLSPSPVGGKRKSRSPAAARGSEGRGDGMSEDGRPGSGVMVEEKGVSEDERSEDGRGRAKREGGLERLSVPLGV